MMNYEIKHIVGFEETNLLGNVYYVNHIRWQGRCREMFLNDHAKSVLLELQSGELVMVTTSCSCDYYEELHVFDVLNIRMSLTRMIQNRITMSFDYFKVSKKEEKLVATGRQEIACMKHVNNDFVPAPIPNELRQALQEFSM